MPASVLVKSSHLTVRAHIGDCKTLLAFDLPSKKLIKNLAGFTIRCQPGDTAPYYLHNTLQFQTPASHAQDPKEPANSSLNAPFHKFRWLHVPGSVHQGTMPFLGTYTYVVTPRYFDASGSLQPLDPALSLSIAVPVGPLVSGSVTAGFTRGFTQSQAFTHHFGLKALIRPAGRTLLYDTSQVAGSSADGTQYTYADEYAWLGFTARERIFTLVHEVLANPALRLDLFAYDLNEPDLLALLLQLAAEGRIRVILDNAALHHSPSRPTPEDQFEALFRKAAKAPAAILRGKFARYAHDKVLVVSDAHGATKVLTGSTNFSVTGLYVNSNHVLVFDDPVVAAKYGQVFETAWQGQVKLAPWLASPLASEVFTTPGSPATSITFAPHDQAFATRTLEAIAARIAEEGKRGRVNPSVLFAVMEIDQGTSPVYAALKTLHSNPKVFSYGISDSTAGISLYARGRATGVLATGKPSGTVLPPPFDQVRNVGLGHQIHHKFVVCGFNGPDPVVYCGSSNLALGGEQANGDNLLEIHDAALATAFAIEALGLVDHFDFLDRNSPVGKTKASGQGVAKGKAATTWYLSTTDKWAAPYFDPKDLHFTDRQLFA